MISTSKKPDTSLDEACLAAFQQPAAPGQPAWLASRREAALASFTKLGFPTLQHEDWRFTNVSAIAQLPFKPVTKLTTAGLTKESVRQFTFAKLDANRLVFVNGLFAPELSVIGKLPAGVKVSSLAAALKSDAALLEKHLARYANTEANTFTALNTAFFQDGAFIFVPAGTVVAQPIHLLNIFTAPEAGATAQPRNLIIAEANSQLTVLESYVATTATAYFTNAVTELIAGDNAVVEHLKFQDEAASAFHIAAFHAHLGKTSNVIHHSIAAGAKISRNNIRTNLAGEGLECILNGLYLTKGEQLADHHMVVEHAQPHCASHEYFNGILDDKSKGVFHGRIYVHPIAQKTDAKQTNKNLLLSDDATADTKPQLEIYADDVKCTHGATIGQLNAESIYYLRSRGIGKDTARQMLIHAFAGEIIERVRHEAAREELDRIIWDRLEANPHLAGK
ncbi:MAG: Fe-S cluster assembly protein SufD [Verrucomicrobia bacterium]|nr:Fe-S cluster assembly protein SufD [Verrucomicrobiota bacterium]